MNFRFLPRSGSILTALALGLAGLSAEPAVAEFKIETERVYYDVSGTSIADIEGALYREARDRTGCSKCYAKTKWKVRWRFKYETDDGRCTLTRAQVTADVSYVLPRWPGLDSGAPEIQAKWRTMIQALTAHEENHGKNGIETGKKVERALLALPPAPDCDALKASISATTQRLIAEGNAWDDAYDERTKYGRTEGADLE